MLKKKNSFESRMGGKKNPCWAFEDRSGTRGWLGKEVYIGKDYVNFGYVQFTFEMVVNFD